jgi:hypothetical protein
MTAGVYAQLDQAHLHETLWETCGNGRDGATAGDGCDVRE